MLDKFKDNMENNMNNLDKKVIEKENDFYARLSRLNDNIKKINLLKKRIVKELIQKN